MFTRPSSLFLLISLVPTSLFSQVNSWTKPTSGNWEEPYWSLGRPPAFDDRVFINSPGWKAVQINGNTVQTIPNSLTMYSLEVSSPVDSFNTLLLNYAGFDRPLTVNYSMTIGNNAALTMHSSAVRIQTPTGVGLSIGGEVNQNDSSQVTGNQADVGWVGPGVYNLNSGLLQLEHFWIGGPNHGVFNQNGGSNACHIVHLEIGGVYNLRDGDFNAEAYFTTNTVFRQDGGRFNVPMTIFRGQYILNGGVKYGATTLPVYAEYRKGDATVFHNGGTNLGAISLGNNSDFGVGRYFLSNGVVQTPALGIAAGGFFQQVGGRLDAANAISVRGGMVGPGTVSKGYFTLIDGVMTAPGINIDTANFGQEGGTNVVNGTLGVGPSMAAPTSSAYGLNGGLLTTINTTASGGFSGGFFHNGGTHRVANELSLSGDSRFYSRAYLMAGGNLIVSNITATGVAFARSGGTLVQSGSLRLVGGILEVGSGSHAFGPLGVSSIEGAPPYGKTNNTVTMPSNACVLRFRDSAAMAWTPNATLIIYNWNGSYLGGGAHQIIFGNSASALTSAQVRQIFFQDPGGGLSPGLHPTKILASGEIVPDSTPPVGRIPPRMFIRKNPGGGFQVTLQGEPGYNYGILRQFYLTEGWSLWTSGTATNGTLTFVDPETWPPQRFYKGVLMR